jgi:hypothetical protein
MVIAGDGILPSSYLTTSNEQEMMAIVVLAKEENDQ